MTMRRETLRQREALIVLVMMIGLIAPMVLGRFGWVTLARTRVSSLSSLGVSGECEGDACEHVTVTFDESKQQYRVRNNSTDRWTHVTASNLAATATACLGPGKDAYLQLKSIDGPYRADFADARCGEQGPEGVPPAAGE